MLINYIANSNNALGKLKINNGKAKNDIQKLSSGLRINKSADDSAGLAISEKMKAQIRGLNQAKRNIEDGISLTQVSDGGMDEINDILQRVRELAVQASNDTNTDDDRNAIQAEVDSLISEIDFITDNTEFNGIKVLKGGTSSKHIETTVGGMPSWTHPIPTKLTQVVVGSFTTSTGQVVDRKHSIATIDFSKANASNIKDLVGNGFYSTCCTCTEKYSIRFVDGPTNSTGSPNPIIEIDISNVSTPQQLTQAIENQSMQYMTHFTKIMVDPNDPRKIQIIDPRIDAVPDPQKDLGIVGAGVVETTVNTKGGTELNIQLGANSDENIKLLIPNTTCDELKITNLLMNPIEEANNSIQKIDNAINLVSNERNMMGTYQNGLEHSYNNAANHRREFTTGRK